MPRKGHVFNMRIVKHLKNGNCYLVYNPKFKELFIGKCNCDDSIDLTWGVTIGRDKYTKLMVRGLLEDYDHLVDISDHNDIYFKLKHDEILRHVVADQI